MVAKLSPASAAELEEFLTSDPLQVKEAFKDPAAAAAFIKGYAERVNKRDPELDEQAKAQLHQEIEKFLNDNGYVKVKGGRTRMLPIDDRTGQALTYSKEEAIDFLRGLAVKGSPGNMAARLKISDEVLKVLNESSGGDGGFLVPDEFRAELLRVAVESAVVRPRASVIPMGSATLRYPSIKATSHASTLFGGVSAAWINEAADLSTVTQPTFAQVLLTARKLTGYTRVTRELLQDSPISLDTLIRQLFGVALPYFEDDAFINGTGAGQPLGILNADALVAIAKETGQAASTVVWENLVKMYARLLPSSIGRAAWLINPDVFPQLALMSLNVGTGGSAIWLNNGVEGPPMRILGLPVIRTEKCQTLGTAGDIYLADLSYYLIGDRQAMEMSASEHANFTTDEMTYRFTQRVDGRPWIHSAITPRFGTNTLSPFLSLATRA